MKEAPTSCTNLWVYSSLVCNQYWLCSIFLFMQKSNLTDTVYINTHAIRHEMEVYHLKLYQIGAIFKHNQSIYFFFFKKPFTNICKYYYKHP